MSSIRMSLAGRDALSSALSGVVERLAAASTGGVQLAGDAIVSNIGSEMGAPRWGHRGKSRIYPAAVNIGAQRGGSSSGPMGRFTGVYASSFGVTVTPGPTGALGVVKLDLSIPGNSYKAHNEAKYPTFKPAALKGAASFRIACAQAWAAVL